MEVNVSNVPVKYCPESLIKDLFSQIGHIIYMSYAENRLNPLATCRIIYVNHSEALKAVCLDGVELGDRKLSVKMASDYSIFVSEQAKSSLSVQNECKCLWVSTPSHYDNTGVKELCGNAESIVHILKLSSSSCWLVEFDTRQSLLQGLLKLRTKAANDEGLKLKGEEAWKMVDPSRTDAPQPVKERLIYGVPESKLLSGGAVAEKTSREDGGRRDSSGTHRRDERRHDDRSRDGRHRDDRYGRHHDDRHYRDRRYRSRSPGHRR